MFDIELPDLTEVLSQASQYTIEYGGPAGPDVLLDIDGFEAVNAEMSSLKFELYEPDESVLTQGFFSYLGDALDNAGDDACDACDVCDAAAPALLRKCGRRGGWRVGEAGLSLK